MNGVILLVVGVATCPPVGAVVTGVFPGCEAHAAKVGLSGVVRVGRVSNVDLDGSQAKGRMVPTPRRIKYVAPSRVMGSRPLRCPAVWVGEVILNHDGSVAGAWPLSDLPEDTQRNEAVRAAVSQWRYEPTLVHGRPVPVCMTVTETVK